MTRRDDPAADPAADASGQARAAAPCFTYELMAAALDWLDAHRTEHPTLDEVAAAIGLSPAHFQRTFSAWVGVSPKRYVQYLTIDHARRLLAERMTVLDTAHETGLSGPSRLHDLFVRWEAMTPGTYARRGEGLTLAAGTFESPFGPVLAMGTEAGLCGLAFTADTGHDAAHTDLAARWPAARIVENPAPLRASVEAAFGGSGELRLAPMGAPFQIKVWEALLRVPEGQVTTYSEIAKSIGRPAAVRAVGSAVGRNPISWAIPCHRAIRRDGALGGYHWGLKVKRAMLAWEAARADAA